MIDWRSILRSLFLDWWRKVDDRTILEHLRDLGVR